MGDSTMKFDSAFSKSIGLYVNCTLQDDSVTEVTLTAGPVSRTVRGGAASAIVDYLDDGKGNLSSLKVKLVGTEFQKKVWSQIRHIPPGKVLTYGEVAKLVGCPGAARAVGSAMKSNKLPILVPCHRVVSSSGLGGYSAHGGLRTKKKLLDAEGLSTKGN